MDLFAEFIDLHHYHFLTSHKLSIPCFIYQYRKSFRVLIFYILKNDASSNRQWDKETNLCFGAVHWRLAEAHYLKWAAYTCNVSLIFALTHLSYIILYQLCKNLHISAKDHQSWAIFAPCYPFRKITVVKLGLPRYESFYLLVIFFIMEGYQTIYGKQGFQLGYEHENRVPINLNRSSEFMKSSPKRYLERVDVCAVCFKAL